MNLIKMNPVCQLCLLVILSSNFAVFSEAKTAVLRQVAEVGIELIQSIIQSINDYQFQHNLLNSLEEISKNTNDLKILITDGFNRVIEELSVKIDRQLIYTFMVNVHKINQRFENEFENYFTGNKRYQTETIENYIKATINPSDFGKLLSSINEQTTPILYVNNLNPKTVFDVLHDYRNIKVSNTHLIINC